MKRLKAVAVVVLCMLIAESALVYVLCMADYVFQFTPRLSDPGHMMVVSMLIPLRLGMYIVPQTVALYCCLGVSSCKGTFKISFANAVIFMVLTTLLFICLSGDPGMAVENLNKASKEPALYFFILSSFVSPLILEEFSFFRKFLDRAVG